MGDPPESVSDAEEPDPRLGCVVADTYRILSLLGAGSMGDVYEAENVRLGNRVAVKFPRAMAPIGPRAVKRFRREAGALAALRSDHVVTAFDCGELADGTPYLVMERLHGEDLRTLLERNGPLPVRRAVRIMLDACRGVAAVHAAGLIHRDLKPANLFVIRSANGSEHCKILDFGVVKTLASDATRPGVVLGTVRYMPPEQLENSASASPMADSYALGAILYECLTGQPAHRGETTEELMFDILHRDPRRPSSLRPVPPELDDLLLRALDRTASKRFESADALTVALEAFDRRTRPAGGRSTDADATSDVSLDETARPLPAKRPEARWVGVIAGTFAAGFACAWAVHGAGTNVAAQSAPVERRPLVALVPSAAAVRRAAPAPEAIPSSAVAEPTHRTVAIATPSRDAAKLRGPSRPIPRAAVTAPVQASRSPPVTQSVADRYDQKNPYADP